MNDTCAPFRVPSSEIDLRVRSLQAELKDTSIPAILIIQRVDLFYLSGTAQNSVLFVPAEGKPLLMVRKYYPRAKDESPLRNIIEIRSIKEITGLISDFFGKTPETMGLELDVMPVNSYLFYKRLFPETSLVDASPAILKVRARKSQWEIEQMEKTALLSQKVFLHLGEIIRPGISEIDLAADTESFARKKG
ncbi:MAG: aminopeptidase P family protein, partial [Deltaproteobacteria bacterium CG17_big_fil_post_rev_8_21_14_2_50_51_6]